MPNSFPYVTANILGARVPVTPETHKILLVGQKVGAGSATSGDLQEDILSESNFNDLFGATSQLAKMGRALVQHLDISRLRPKIATIGLDDNGSGVAATGTFVISGTATAAGILTFYVDSLNNQYDIAVASGDTSTVVGDALEAAITADTNSVVTAGNVTGTVTLTAVNAGTQGNTIGLKHSGSVAGLTVTSTLMTGGATNPVLTTLFDPIVDIRYHTIVYPHTWGVSTLTDFTEPRFNVDNKVLDGLGLTCSVDTYANLNTELDGLNEKTLAVIPNRLIAVEGHRGGAIFESPDVIAASVAAYRGLRLIPNSNVSSISVNGLGLGGYNWGALPYHNTPFALLPVIETGKDFTDAEAGELESSGGWVFRNNPANTVLISNEAVTTYKTNTLGNPDITFKYVNYVDTASLVREYYHNNLKADFAQHKLTTGDLIDGQPMVNFESFIATMKKYYLVLATDPQYALLRAGSAELAAFAAELESTVINLATGTITADAIANIVTQVRNIIVNFTPTFE